ncbi:unnamed protein product [Calypogeia fissa]
MAQQQDAMTGQFEEAFEDRNAGPEREETGPWVTGKTSTTFSNDEEALKYHRATDQVHKDAISINTAGALEPAGDGVEKSAARSVEASNSSPRGTGHYEGVPPSPAATSKVPSKGLGEMIIDKLPFTRVNPYSLGREEPPQTAANPYTEGDQSAAPATPSGQRSKAKSSSSLWRRLKNSITSQKASKGTATENATTATAGTSGEHQPLIRGYAESHPREERRPSR